MSSEVPTINLFDNDNSSGSFFETFAQAGESDHHNNQQSTPASGNIQHTNNNAADLFQSSSAESSLFGESDHSHSFFDTLSTETSAPTSFPTHSTTTPVHATFAPPPATFTQPPTSTPPTTPPPVHRNDSLPRTVSPPPTTSTSYVPSPLALSPAIKQEIPTQVVTPAGVIDSSDQQIADALFSSTSYDHSVDSLFFDSLALSDNGPSLGHPTPPAPYPATPPHNSTEYRTPQSALNEPLPVSPLNLHHRAASDNSAANIPPQASLARRGSGSDLPSTYESSLSAGGIGPSPLRHNSSYNALSPLEHSSPLAPSSPASYNASPPLSRVNTPPPAASVSSPSPLRPTTPPSNTIAPPSPAPSTHLNETSPLLTHSSHQPSSADEHEAPIPHFASTGDDQNIFDSFLSGSQQPNSASFFGNSASSSLDYSAPTSSTQSASSSSFDPSSSSASTNVDQSTSSTQSYDYTNYYAQYSQYGNYGYDYTNYNQTGQYTSQDTSNANQYASQNNTNATQAGQASQYTSQDATNANQYSQYQYDNNYGQQSYNNQTGYDQQYPSYPYSSQYSQQYQTNQSYDQYSNNQYTQPADAYTNTSSNNYTNNQYANNQYTNNNQQYNNNYSTQYNNQYGANSQYSDQQYPSYATTTQQQNNTTPVPTTSSYTAPSVPAPTNAYSNWTPQQTGNTNNDTLLFNRPHPIVTFGFCGKMAIFRPNSSFVDTRVVKVESVRTVLQRTPFLEPFSTYPGPLTSSTSKDAVARWIGERIAQSTDDGTTLLWELLKVMCEHYGTLMKSPDSSTNPETVVQKLLIDPNENFDLPTLSTPPPASLQEVQNLLLAGDRAEACRVAATTHNWSHALLLAQFCGPEVYASTIANFATTALPEGSPLRTMYLLYGRQPQEIFRASGGTSNALLSKWRANLAAILATSPANHGNTPAAQPDRRVAAELGDRLWGAQGHVEAAHCCYLLADLPHGPLDNPNTRIVLLGADHKRKRATNASSHQGQGFASNFTVNVDAIIRSEIYEWSKVLGNSQYVLPGIHPYKLAYATLVADLGFPDVAVHYVQQLSAAVRAHKGGTQMFTPHYLYQLDTFEERLRGTGAAKSLVASGSWLPRMAKGFSRLFGSEVKGPTAPAEPKKETPKKGSSFISRRTQEEVPAPAVANTSSNHTNNASGLTKEEEEYAASFSTKKKEPKEGEKPAKEVKETKDTKIDDDAPQKGGVLSRFAFWKKSGTEAKLGEENAFEWNDQLKMWVEKGKPLPSAEPERPPPPPSFAPPATPPPPHDPAQSFTSPPLSAGGPPPATSPGIPAAGGGPPPSFTSPVAAAGGRRKPRYFDSFNDQVYTAKSGGSGTPNTATPDKSNVKIFTPFTPPTPFVPSTPQPSSDDPSALPPPNTPPPPQY